MTRGAGHISQFRTEILALRLLPAGAYVMSGMTDMSKTGVPPPTLPSRPNPLFAFGRFQGSRASGLLPIHDWLIYPISKTSPIPRLQDAHKTKLWNVIP